MGLWACVVGQQRLGNFVYCQNSTTARGAASAGSHLTGLHLPMVSTQVVASFRAKDVPLQSAVVGWLSRVAGLRRRPTKLVERIRLEF